MLQPIQPPNPFREAAERRAQELSLLFNENVVLAILDRMMAEVDAMPLASRFTDREIYAAAGGPPPDLNPVLLGMSERDHKRWHLRRHFQEMRERVVSMGHDFRVAVMEMEASKID